MAEVWEASDEILRRTVALKVVLPAYAESSEIRIRFLREARFAGGLAHSHILPVHDYGQEGETAYLVMPYLTAGGLTQRIVEPVPRTTAVAWLRDLASALDYAHLRGVIHRDVKPANILFNDEGRVLICDFGIAKSLDSSTTSVTVQHSVLGTAVYMSPEQALAQQADSKSDQYSLGILAYRLLTGQLPIEGVSAVIALHKTIYERLPLPSEKAADLPYAVDEVFSRVLAKQPGHRFDSCGAFVSALDSALREDAPGAHPAGKTGEAPIETIPAAPGSEGLVLRVLTTSLATIGVVGVYLLFARQRPADEVVTETSVSATPTLPTAVEALPSTPSAVPRVEAREPDHSVQQVTGGALGPTPSPRSTPAQPTAGVSPLRQSSFGRLTPTPSTEGAPVSHTATRSVGDSPGGPPPRPVPSPANAAGVATTARKLIEQGRLIDAEELLMNALPLHGQDRGVRKALLTATCLSENWGVAMEQVSLLAPFRYGEEAEEFHAALALFQNGEVARARQMLEGLSKRLRRTTYVEWHSQRIFGVHAASTVTSEKLVERARTAITDGRLLEARYVLEEALKVKGEIRAFRLLLLEAATLAKDFDFSLEQIPKIENFREGEENFAFYAAVARFETGDVAAAQTLLGGARSRLASSAYVDYYSRKILGK